MAWQLLRIIGGDLARPMRVALKSDTWEALGGVAVIGLITGALFVVGGFPWFMAFRMLGWSPSDSYEGAMWSILGCIFLVLGAVD